MSNEHSGISRRRLLRTASVGVPPQAFWRWVPALLASRLLSHLRLMVIGVPRQPRSFKSFSSIYLRRNSVSPHTGMKTVS